MQFSDDVWQVSIVHLKFLYLCSILVSFEKYEMILDASVFSTGPPYPKLYIPPNLLCDLHSKHGISLVFFDSFLDEAACLTNVTVSTFARYQHHFVV